MDAPRLISVARYQNSSMQCQVQSALGHFLLSSREDEEEIRLYSYSALVTRIMQRSRARNA